MRLPNNPPEFKPLLRDLLRDPPRLLVTILLGNELVNVAASNLGAMLDVLKRALGR